MGARDEAIALWTEFLSDPEHRQQAEVELRALGANVPRAETPEPSAWEKIKGGAESATRTVGGFMEGVNRKASMGAIPAIERALGVRKYSEALAAESPTANALGEGTGLGLAAIATRGGSLAAPAITTAPKILPQLFASPAGVTQRAVDMAVHKMAPWLAKKLATSAPARVTSAALTNVGAGAATEGIEARLMDQPVGPAMKRGATWGGLLGGGSSAAGELMEAVGGPVARSIRGSNTPTGEDIRVLEEVGASPSPLPFRPVSNAPSKRLGVRPTSRGRGRVAEEGARQLEDELIIRERINSQRLREELPRAIERQGDRLVDMDPLIAHVDAELASPRNQALPSVISGLTRVRDMLTSGPRSAASLNAIRDAMDDISKIAAAGTDINIKNLPFQRLANEMRATVRSEAPAIGLANRRYSAVRAKSDLMRERMKSPADEENLAMQIAGLGEEGSKVSGRNEPRMEELRRQFPTSERLRAADVSAAFDRPRALLAEERLQLKRLPRIGGGGGDALNFAEPLVARGVYPAAREMEFGGGVLRGVYPTAEGASVTRNLPWFLFADPLDALTFGRKEK